MSVGGGGVGFTPDAAGRVAKATREVEQQMQNPLPQRARWFGHEEPDGIPCFINNVGESIPAFGVVSSASFNKTMGFYVHAPRWPVGAVSGEDGSGRQDLYINGAKELESTDEDNKPRRGKCFTAIDKPRMVLYNNDLGRTPLVGQTWGPIDDTHKIGPGIPGFTIVGPIDVEDVTVGVVRQLNGLTGWCKANTDWSGSGNAPFVTVNPVAGGLGFSSNVYDGVFTVGGSDPWPEIEFNVTLWRTSDKDPNVFEDDIFPYRLGFEDYRLNAEGAVYAAFDYLDDKIGTIKIWLPGADPPRGWRDYSALNDADAFLRAGASTSGSPVADVLASGTDHDAASVRLIERFE